MPWVIAAMKIASRPTAGSDDPRLANEAADCRSWVRSAPRLAMCPNLFRVARRSVLIALWPLLVSRGPAEITKYQGFTIDDSRMPQDTNREDVRAAIREQIDIVTAVGLPPDILKFFQTVPFRFVPAESIRSATPGLYSAQDRAVKVTSRVLSIGRRPVLLHELLHAYHHQRVPNGVKNAALIRLFEQAKSAGSYAPKSHMMQNPGEFFACAATTFLFGVTAQEPFKREAIKDRQPELFAYLAGMFAPNGGSHAGSLSR
jgi:hypothetical protein